MHLHPVLAALRKHKAGAFLIGLQIALTLAIVCNILFIVGLRVQRIARPTGLAENDLFLIVQSYVDAPTGVDAQARLDALQATDLATLRGLTEVQAAAPVSSLPLLRRSSIQDIALTPGQRNGLTKASFFFGDEHLLPTLGLRLVAGRDFTGADVERRVPASPIAPPQVIVTQALAERLFPGRSPIGQPIYVNGSTTPSVIVGEVARMLTSDADGVDAYAWNSVLVPARIDAAATMYAVRARPGRAQAAMEQARQALFKANPLRILEEQGRYSPSGIHDFAQIRAMGYALDLFVVQVLTAICAILLAVTGVGMTGLTSFWVGRRYKQIGIRRALGARKRDILGYFQLENLCIAGAGCVAGAVLAIVINQLLLRLFALDRMPAGYVLAGVAAILVLGQFAVLAPAWRAAKVPPAVATRSL
ncbi:MAG: ABC transporter permease [Pseudoxanthomonas sp.]